MRIRQGIAWARLQVSEAMVLLFVGVISAGTLLLLLPVSRLKPISFVDAVFTATSATCVTGLLTINVAENFTLFGQAVILVLIQFGGLGIIFVSTIFMLVLGRAVSYRDSAMVYSSFSTSHSINFEKLIYSILVLVFGFELLGTILLTSAWYGEYGFKIAFFTALFHSISAFCNAGISILPEGLKGFDSRPFVDTIVMMQIAFGATGFFVFRELYERFKYQSVKRRVWSLQSRLMMLYTAIFVIAGTIGFLFFEYHNTLSQMPFGQKIMNSLFHSISGRTAGFSNLDVGEFNPTTLYMFIIFMFIGGAPGSVAGGIKITTFAVLIGLAVSRYKGNEHVNIFNHTIPETIVSRSISIVFISFAVVTVFLFLLLITEGSNPAFSSGRHGAFLDILFETVSANGTVGLSTGITSSLSVTGKWLVILLMLIGRLGPLTVAMAVGSRRRTARYKLSEESVMVG